MNSSIHRLSLFTQLSIVMVLLLSTMSILHTYHAIRIEKRSLSGQLDSDIQSNMKSLANQAGQLLVSDALHELEESMLELIVVEEITDLKVVANSGNILAHVSHTENKEYTARYDISSIKLPENIITNREWKIIKGDQFIYGQPVTTSHVIGWIIAEGNTLPLKKLYYKILINNLLWALAIIFFVIIIMILFYKKISRAFHEVVMFSERIITSPGEQFLPVSGTKEIYQLTHALNKSSIQLLKQKDEIEIQQEALQFKAGHDSLTGLPNRSLLMDRLNQAIKTCRRNNSDIAVLFMDLNDFKPVNDNYGHEIGDILLKQTAERLSSCIRESDTMARIGGDEFVALLPDITHDSDLANITLKIKEEITKPYSIDKYNINISISIGDAFFSEGCQTAEELIEHADHQMYKNKKHSKDIHTDE